MEPDGKLRKNARVESRFLQELLPRQCSRKLLENCILSMIFDNKTDGQQWILVDFYGHQKGYLSVKWTLVDLYGRGKTRGAEGGTREGKRCYMISIGSNARFIRSIARHFYPLTAKPKAKPFESSHLIPRLALKVCLQILHR
jgi:hypothetical protein